MARDEQSQTPPTTRTSSPTRSRIRSRALQACDRCRMKKSKCDGQVPCGRCRAQNTICVFGERKRSRDRVYSKAYVEILEFQQTRLIKGLQELYRRTQNDQGWSGAPLDESENGAPLTHEILERIGALKRDAREEPPHDIYGRRLSALQQDMVLEPSGPPLKKRKVSTRESCSDHCESSRLAKYGSLVPPPSDTCGHSEPRGFDFDALYSHSTSTTPPEMFSNSPRFEASDEKQIFTGSLFLLNDESELINDLGFPMEYYYQSHDDFTTVSAINPDLSQVLDGAGENPGTPRLGRHLGFGSSVRPTASLGEHQQCTSMACKSCYDVSNYDAY